MYKTESTLGLIGSILALIATMLVLLAVLLFSFVFNWGIISDLGLFYNVIETMRSIAIPVVAIAAIVGFILLIGTVVLGFIGSSMLRKDNKNGGILLIVAGGLMLLPLSIGANIFGMAISVLFLIGGIMALTKNRPQHE